MSLFFRGQNSEWGAAVTLASPMVSWKCFRKGSSTHETNTCTKVRYDKIQTNEFGFNQKFEIEGARWNASLQ